MARGRPMTKEYICYKGDVFVMIGTAREISEQTGVSLKYLYKLATRQMRKRKNLGKRSGWIIVPLEEDEYETVEY